MTDSKRASGHIAEFEGEYFFLSNFSPHPVRIDGVEYPTAEHAFQALKTDSKENASKFAVPGLRAKLNATAAESRFAKTGTGSASPLCAEFSAPSSKPRSYAKGFSPPVTPSSLKATGGATNSGESQKERARTTSAASSWSSATSSAARTSREPEPDTRYRLGPSSAVHFRPLEFTLSTAS